MKQATTRTLTFQSTKQSVVRTNSNDDDLQIVAPIDARANERR